MIRNYIFKEHIIQEQNAKSLNLYELSRFIVTENYTRHVVAYSSETLKAEVEKLAIEENLYADFSTFYVARDSTNQIIGVIRILQWDKKIKLPTEKIYGINPLKIKTITDMGSIWHIGRFAVRGNNKKSGISLFKQLSVLAIAPLYYNHNDIALAECDSKLIRVLSALGMQSNTYALAVNGQVWTTAGVLITSDGTLKKNIRDMEEQRTDFVCKLRQLKSKTYEKLVVSGKDNEAAIYALVADGKIPVEEAAAALKDLNESNKDTYKNEYGFIAQDVKELFPDLVEADENGQLAINYTGLIPVLLEAIKDLQDKVEQLEKQNSNDDVTIRGSKITTNADMANSDYLSQNVPNPVDGSTVIRYSLPDGATQASIVIYSNTGAVVKIIPLDAGAKSGSITLYASDLAKGINIYNLTANGVVLGTKKMINR